MQNKQSAVKTGRLVTRGKAQSFTQNKSTRPLFEETLQFSTLSSSAEFPQPPARRMDAEQLMEYAGEVLDQVYRKDALRVREKSRQYMKEKGSEMKGKVKERLSMLKYLEGELKYRSFSEIEVEILKEWRKNPLLFSLATIWMHCMLTHTFTSASELAGEYHHMRSLVANVSHFYFKGCLRIIHSKGADCLSLLYEETAHQVICGLKEWAELYGRLLGLLRGEGGWEMNLDFDLRVLRVNPQYLRPGAAENQLPQTTSLISRLAKERNLFQMIELLRKIRQTFLQEITQSNKRIMVEENISKVSAFEKDDILDCMLYCIVRGQVAELGLNLQAMGLLVGKDSEMLGKKGVDCYRADLAGAVQYLCEEQLTSPIIKMPRNLLSTRLTSFQQ